MGCVGIDCHGVYCGITDLLMNGRESIQFKVQQRKICYYDRLKAHYAWSLADIQTRWKM